MVESMQLNSASKYQVSCVGLGELPEPPKGKTGWPWTEASSGLPARSPEGDPWPLVSIITPSFNQGQFLEETIRSILLQGYPDLEYFILDGGSTDGSVEIIKKYSPWISYWVSEPDNGQSEAINRGLKMASGVFTTWINSDDMLFKNAFAEHASRIGFDSSLVYVGICAHTDEAGKVVSMHRARVHSLKDLLWLPQVWRKGGNIVQPEVLFPRKLALDVGCLTPDNHSCMDYELWGKFFLAGAKFKYTDVPFGMHRRHADQKSNDLSRSTEALKPVTKRLLERANSLSKEEKDMIREELDAYFAAYPEIQWRESGRLARLGLPKRVVTGIRQGRRTLEKTLGYLVGGSRSV
jgi:glycosyltransferase involved in cell wall biosynthesis